MTLFRVDGLANGFDCIMKIHTLFATWSYHMFGFLGSRHFLKTMLALLVMW